MNGKRLAIMVLYDALGELPKYAEILLKEVKKNVDDLVIAFNGNIQELSYKKLEAYSDKILVRGNEGFDAGAYKDAIEKIMLDVNWKNYTQLVLLNDSFFGFFYPLEEYFAQTLSDEEIDFWGITRFPEWNEKNDKKIESHLQSYFLIINNRMMHSKQFAEFWSGLQYPQTLSQAVDNFEVRFTSYFEKRGFSSKAFCEIKGEEKMLPAYVKNPYQDYIYELVTERRCPILKIKSILLTDAGPYKVIDFLKEKNLYDSSLIWEYLQSESAFRRFGKSAFDCEKLVTFCRDFSDIYLYGHGIWARRLRSFLKYKNILIRGNIVTKREFGEQGQREIIEFSKLHICRNMGIILALNKKNTEEVLPLVRQKVPDMQIFVGDYF